MIRINFHNQYRIALFIMLRIESFINLFHDASTRVHVDTFVECCLKLSESHLYNKTKFSPFLVFFSFWPKKITEHTLMTRSASLFCRKQFPATYGWHRCKHIQHAQEIACRREGVNIPFVAGNIIIIAQLTKFSFIFSLG